jgi:hypothetical protein
MPLAGRTTGTDYRAMDIDKAAWMTIERALAGI